MISAAPVFGLQGMEELIQPAAASVGIKTTTGSKSGILQNQIKQISKEIKSIPTYPNIFTGM